MASWLNFFVGKTPRERLGTAMNYGLIATVVVLAMQIKWMSKSPNPAEWNYYSAEANDYLYSSTEAMAPMPMAVVAHRGGSVPDDAQAGPIRRLDYSYQNGHRLVELDFSWTSDNEIVVKHDWKSVKTVPTLDAYLAESPDEHASLQMIYAWMDQHPDVFVVTDCKKRSLEFFAKVRMERPGLVPRFIPQIYQMKDYKLAKSQGYRHIVLTLYRCLADAPTDQVVDFAASHDLFALTVPLRRVQDSDIARRVRELGIPVYVHTINDVDQVPAVIAAGCSGVYSDTLHNEQLMRLAVRNSL
ncbi:MAG: hypothetical protein AAGG48_12065 [Planctomycetota bacterium]